jgi:hypothetical protein
MSGDGLTTCLWFDGQAEEAAAHDCRDQAEVDEYFDIAALERAYAGEGAAG